MYGTKDETMIYPNYLVRRPDDQRVLACAKTLTDAKRIKAGLDQEETELARTEPETFGPVGCEMQFEIFDNVRDKVVVEGRC